MTFRASSTSKLWFGASSTYLERQGHWRVCNPERTERHQIVSCSEASIWGCPPQLSWHAFLRGGLRGKTSIWEKCLTWGGFGLKQSNQRSLLRIWDSMFLRLFISFFLRRFRINSLTLWNIGNKVHIYLQIRCNQINLVSNWAQSHVNLQFLHQQAETQPMASQLEVFPWMWSLHRGMMQSSSLRWAI